MKNVFNSAMAPCMGAGIEAANAYSSLLAKDTHIKSNQLQIDAAYAYQLEIKRLHLGTPSLRDQVFGVASGHSSGVQAAAMEALKLVVDGVQTSNPGVGPCWACCFVCLIACLSLRRPFAVGVLHWQDDKLVNTVGALGLLYLYFSQTNTILHPKSALYTSPRSFDDKH